MDERVVTKNAVVPMEPIDGGSHVVGGAMTMLEDTVSGLLARACLQSPSHDALVFPDLDLRWSYLDLKQQVDTLAAAFLAAGFEPGDRVGIWSPNRPEWVVTQFATAKVGLVLVTINPAYRVSELEYALNKVACKGLVMAASFKSSQYVEMLESIAPELQQAAPGQLKAAKVSSLHTVVVIGDTAPAGAYTYQQLLALGNDDWCLKARDVEASLKPDQPINIQFTSGTTGSPKGATLSHRNIVNNGANVIARMGFGADDRLCIPVPLYHCFGMVMGVLGCVSLGATMVFPGEAFEPEATLKAVQAERCTGLFGVPTMFVAMLEHPAFVDFEPGPLRTGIMAGAPCPIEVMKQIMAEMNMNEVTIAYGMTETSPVSFQSHTDDPLEKRVSTVGRVHPGVEVKVIDEQGEICPVGASGELCTRGYSVMTGYWDDQAKTADSIDTDGWMRTGDLAVIDHEGYCSIVGRLKDMVIRGGENLYPREIEEFLYTHAAVQQVQVFGVPDPKYGEELCAWVVLKAGAELSQEVLQDFCKGQIAHHKIPRYVHFVDELPMTVTGKPQKFLMRRRMAEILGIEEV
ncbi:MAG: AMP-binding protein [Granulosicoccaceae bacterium]